MCQERQREILSDIWQCLKPGGLLIYSTCTYNTLENEENAAWAAEQLGAELLSIDIPSEWNISSNKLSSSSFNVYRFFPHKTQGEGFFACIMRKNSDAEISPTRTPKNKEHKKGADNRKGKELPIPKDIKQWLFHPEQYTFKSTPTSHTAFPTQHIHLLEQVLAHLKVIHYGITIANIKGKTIIPAHSLAMSASLNAEMFPSTELTEQQAIAYLRTESITLSPSTPTGYVLLKYKGLPLGFAKNIGNRANNLYPSEWRIRKSI
jgi:NOL1/NOP2/fmu family ribosome biogenesis protein